MFVTEFKKYYLGYVTLLLPLLIWLFILYFVFYKSYIGVSFTTRGYASFLILLFPIIWTLHGLFSIISGKQSSGLVEERPGCLDLSVTPNLKNKGVVGLYKPACKNAQVKTTLAAADTVNQIFNFLLQILFLTILIFFEIKRKTIKKPQRIARLISVLVVLLLLGSIFSTGFLRYPYRGLIYTRVATGFSILAATVLTFVIFGFFVHIYA